MPETATPVIRSLDDFLAWEERQAGRFEFLPGGIIRLMTGGTFDHNQIATNIVAGLRPQLRGRRCFVHAADAKVLSRATTSATYPDVFVRCGEPAGAATSIDDPVVVVEVLSEGTIKDDLTRKRQVYKAIPSLRVLVYVSTDQFRLDIVRRGADGRFDDEVVEGREGTLDMPEIGATLAMAEIYEDTSLARTAETTA